MTDSNQTPDHWHHEHGDPDPEILISPITKSVVALLVTTVVFAVLMIPLVSGFDELVESKVDDVDRIELARPAGPLLQPSPEAQMEDFRQNVDAVIGSYGWTDQSAGIARMPVERAKAMILSEGVGPVGVAQLAEEVTQ